MDGEPLFFPPFLNNFLIFGGKLSYKFRRGRNNMVGTIISNFNFKNCKRNGKIRLEKGGNSFRIVVVGRRSSVVSRRREHDHETMKPAHSFGGITNIFQRHMQNRHPS